jgi:hypothetical protein
MFSYRKKYEKKKIYRKGYWMQIEMFYSLNNTFNILVGLYCNNCLTCFN